MYTLVLGGSSTSMFFGNFQNSNTHSLSGSLKSSQNAITADSRFGFPLNTGNEQVVSG